jgi:hypothetical protein
MTFEYETTSHIISGIRILGEESYDKALDRHLNKMGRNGWELVGIEKATQILTLDPMSPIDLTVEQANNSSSPREVFIMFWKRRVNHRE